MTPAAPAPAAPGGSGSPLNTASAEMTAGPERAPNRAMLRAIGFGDDDFRLPIIGIASAGAEVSPCNIHHDELAALAKAEFIASGAAKPMKFNTFLVTDGEAMGTEGMKASLPSRDVIADAIELVVRGHSMDALLAIGGCDKTVPGSIMPMARLDIPSIFCYGGTIKAGCTRAASSTSSASSRRSGPTPRAGWATRSSIPSNARPARARARAAACTPRTRWPRRRKPSA